MEIVISTEERNLLEEVMEQYRRELLREIARTHHHDFKTALQHKEAQVESLLSKLSKAKLADSQAA